MIQLLAAPLMALIERLIPDKAKSDQAKAEMMTIMMQAKATEMESKSKVIIAEANGESAAQRNWRPHLMYLFMYILAFNFIIAPMIAMTGFIIPTLQIPSHMWGLLTVGVGGYIGGRSLEKTTATKVRALNEEKYFQSLRESFGPLSKEFVDSQNKALKDSQHGS